MSILLTATGSDLPPTRTGWESRRLELIARYGSEDDVPLNEWDEAEYRRVCGLGGAPQHA